MLLAPEENAPRARCDTCGSPDIVSVCHHCGKCLCDTHTPRAVDLRGRPVSRELDGLELEGALAAVYHCAEHQHRVYGGALLPYILAGAGVAVLGAIVTFPDLVAGLVLVVLGVGAAMGCYLVQRRWKRAARAVMPALPVMPNLNSVSVRERLSGQISLRPDGTYTSTPQPVEGMVEVAMRLNNSDAERLSAYRARYGLAADDLVEFSAGFAVLDGEAGLSFELAPGAEQWLLPSGTGIALQGVAAGHPLFSTGRGRSAGRWVVRLPYRLQRMYAPTSMPLWLVPSLVPGSDKRTLQLELHWGTLEEERPGEVRPPLTLLRFDRIELAVPTEWGTVEHVSPNALISSPQPDLTRIIEWQRMSPERSDPPQTLTIRFKNPIGNQSRVTGRVCATFRGTFSGISNVDMFWPTGSGWLQPPKAKVTTYAEAGFELSLSSIRYQAVRVVPDGSEDDCGRPEAARYPNVIPGPDTVIDLTNELSDAGYYVKRVTENQPRGGGRAGLVNRVWDIAGRQYDRVLPIDFHITIMGEEEYQDGNFYSSTGNTTARLTVRGSYVSEEMEAKVMKVWDQLHAIVAGKLRLREGPPSAEQPPWS